MTLPAWGPSHDTSPIEPVEPRGEVPLIRRMRSRADHGREIEMARARKRLARGEDPVRVLEAFGLALSNKLLHAPICALHRAGEEREALERVFGVQTGAAR